MKLILHLQKATAFPNCPDRGAVKKWLQAAIAHRLQQAEICVRMVDEAEIQSLNRIYRQQDKPTNVLSFPYEGPQENVAPYLGDLVVCAPVIEQEALAQQKTAQAHWAHMIIHGGLHLLGYDHQLPAEAETMESLETKLLNDLGYANPYGE